MPPGLVAFRRRMEGPKAECQSAGLWPTGWPYSGREMQNVIERAVILSPGPALHIPPGDLKPGAAPADRPAGAAVTLADAEREHVLRALRATHWVLRGPNGAAARLGMKRSTLQWKMKKLGISRPA